MYRTVAASNRNEIVTNLESDLSRFLEWITNNKMVANPKKLQSMFLGFKGQRRLRLNTNENKLSATNHVKLLGIEVDNKLFNLSLSLGLFPDCWKIARVAPVFNDGPADESFNYRPISVLPVVSRLFEKLIYNQLYHYLDSNKLIFGKQSAYR